MQIPINKIYDPRTLAKRYLDAQCPEYAPALMLYLDGVANTDAEVLCDSLSAKPLNGDWQNGVSLRYEIGVERNRFNKKWVKTREVVIEFERGELVA